MRKIRVVLEPNDVQPISFDVVLTGVLPPFFEDRNLVRNRRSGRIDVNTVRYHQGGRAEGTVTVDGETYELGPEDAFGFRDHSWGVRQGVGAPVPDLIRSAPRPDRPPVKGVFKWTPSFCRRPDGTYYETAIHMVGLWTYNSAYVNEADGRQLPIRSVEPVMEYDPYTRFVRRGELRIEMQSGERRVLEVEALGESGFFLKTAGYGAWKGHIHGSWMGALHLDGEHIADCWDEEHVGTLGQLRDTPIRVREGDAEGFGIMESIIAGEWPELGLTAESDRGVAHA
jgi:hypothetical protein